MNIPMETPHFTVREDPNRALKHKRFLLTPRDDDSATDAASSYTVPAPKHYEDPEHINLYEPADASTERDWLKKLGSLTADSLVAPLLHSTCTGRAWDPAATTRLTRLPRGYALYVHKNGHRRAPRRDYYLYGSRSVTVFRSPAEFAPHFVWLMGGRPVKEDGKRACECKYCAHEEGGQRAVNEKMRKKRRTARDGTERGPLSDSPTNLLPRAGPSG